MKTTNPVDVSQPHDLLVKHFLSELYLASDLFKNYLAGEWVELVDFDSLKQESTETVDRNLSGLRADLRYSTRLKGSDEELGVFVFLEHQSRPDRFMAFRLLEYICAAYRQHLSVTGEKKDTTIPPPLTVVLHQGKTPWKKVLAMRDLFSSQHDMWIDTLKFPICLIDLARIPPDQLRGHPALCTLLDSLQSASAGRFPERLLEILGRLKNVREEDKLKSWSMAVSTYFTAVQGKAKENIDILFHALKALLGAREAEKMTATIADGWKAEGIAIGKVEGRAEGIAEGEARGAVKGKIESLLLFLESRFDEVPVSVQKKLIGLHDNKRIEQLTRLAATCQSLKEFQKAL